MDTPRAPTRQEILGVVEDLIRDGVRLASLSGQRFERLPEFNRQIAYLGISVLRSLRTILLLAPHAIDDQMAVVVRGLVEGTVDMEFLAYPSPVKKNGPAVSVEDKTRLFSQFRLIELHHLQKSAFVHEQVKGLRPDEQALLKEAQQLRRCLGIDRQPYWRGLSFTRAVSELKQSPPDSRRTLFINLQDAYAHLSYYTHSNPNYGKTRDEFIVDMVPAFAVISAAHAFLLWELHLEDELPDSILEPVKRRNDYWRRIGFDCG